MIPVLVIPVIGRFDLLEQAIASIDHPVGKLLVIDNSPHGLTTASLPAVVTRPPSNLGYAGSINHAIKTHPAEPWWCFTAADVVFGPGDLARLEAAMTGPRWVGINGDWRAFGLTSAAVDRVGLWDENFHPAYCEDADYEYRCTLAGVEWGFITGTTTHAGSTTIQEARYAERNARTYPANRAYYRAKWGGELRGGETFKTPFDRGGSVREWDLQVSRLRDLSWAD